MDIYQDPRRAIDAMLDNEKGISEWLNYHIANMRRAQAYVAGMNPQLVAINPHYVSIATAYVNSETELSMTPEQLNVILSLFPIEASRLAQGFNDSPSHWGNDDRHELLNIVARYYLNAANWPRNFYRSSDMSFDNPNRDAWMSALKMAYGHFHGPKD